MFQDKGPVVSINKASIENQSRRVKKKDVVDSTRDLQDIDRKAALAIMSSGVYMGSLLSRRILKFFFNVFFSQERGVREAKKDFRYEPVADSTQINKE